MARHGDLRSRRPPHGERARLAFGVLIVAAITAISAGVRLWPASPRAAMHAPLEAPPRPAASPPPASLAIRAADAISGRAPAVHSFAVSPAATVPIETVTAAATHAAPPIAGESPAEERRDGVVAEPAGASAQAEPGPLLASRRLAVTITMPGDPPVHEPHDARGTPPGVVELPAIVVTRAVTVAGRGILTGLRATGAVLRAAF